MSDIVFLAIGLLIGAAVGAFSKKLRALADRTESMMLGLKGPLEKPNDAGGPGEEEK